MVFSILFFYSGEGCLCKCVPIVANLLATLMSYWEVCRNKRVTQSLEQLEATGMIVQMLAQVTCFIPVFQVLGSSLVISANKNLRSPSVNLRHKQIKC